jgi:hypothetical protein
MVGRNEGLKLLVDSDKNLVLGAAHVDTLAAPVLIRQRLTRRKM